jgi:hypothetical protein
MNPSRRVIVTFLIFVLALLVIACSCSSLLPSLIGGSSTSVPMAGLAGTWQDPVTSDTFVVTLRGGNYEVTSVTWEGTSYDITSQSWTGSSLSWSYYDSDLNLVVTYTTTSISGDNLYVNWSYSDGGSGTETLQRVTP